MTYRKDKKNMTLDTDFLICDEALNTGEKLGKLYFKQKDRLKKLYDYVIIRNYTLEYMESKNELDFIASVLLRIINDDETLF